MMQSMNNCKTKPADRQSVPFRLLAGASRARAGVGRKGQAAKTDALYFVMIVTSLAIFLFGFANSYGGNVKQQINAESSTTFATNSLKAILYSSTPRDVHQSLTDTTAEVDFLLSIIKEDYYDDEQVGPYERNVLGKAIFAILNPVQDNFDYAFYITIPSEKRLVFMYLHTTNFKREELSGTLRKFVVYRPDDAKKHVNYFCGIDSAAKKADYDVLSAKLSRLLSNVGGTSQATARTTLLVDDATCSVSHFCPKDAQVDLVLWDATGLGRTDDRKEPLFDADVLNCVEETIPAAIGP